MRFAFTADQELLQNGLREVLKRECAPAVVRAAWDGPPSPALWQTLAGVGVAGVAIPEEHGGLGLGPLEWILLLEECGRFAAPVPLLETSVVAAPLLGVLTPDVLPEIASGDMRVGVGLAGMPFVRDADSSQLLLLESDGELHAVDPRDVTMRPEPSVDRSRRLSRITWAPRASTCLARGDQARRFVNDALDRGSLGAAAELLGLADHMIRMTVEYAKVRKQFGAAIGSFQAVKHHLATALMKLELARPTVYRAAHSLAHADPDRGLHVAMAKACASDAATFAARASLQCHGAIGYSFEHDLHLWMKRAWALSAAWGDAAHHRARVAEVVIGPPSA